MTHKPINLTIQPTRVEHIRKGYRLRLDARTITVASTHLASDHDKDYLVAHFEETGARPRTFTLDRLGGMLVDVVIADVHESDDISYLLTQCTGPGSPYSRGYAAGRRAAADDIGRATDVAIARYHETRAHDDDVVAVTLELAERIALGTEKP